MNDKKSIKTVDEVASMFLGLVIVGALVLIIFNVFNRVKGRVDIPGITDQTQLSLKSEDSKPLVVASENNKEASTYVVARGDSLWKIALKKYGDGNKWVEIAKANNLKNPSILIVGQELKVDQVKKEAVQKTEYKVVKGDNLWKIAVVNYADGYQWTKIWQNNKDVIKDPNKIEIGMVIKLSH